MPAELGPARAAGKGTGLIQVTARHCTNGRTRFAAALLSGTILAGIAAPASAQSETAQPAATAPATQQAVQTDATRPGQDVIRTISVAGTQRLEPNTVLTYIKLRPGQVYTPEAADQALRDLAETELFADYSIRNDNGNVLITVVENPVINRILIEGNKRLKTDKITPEIKLAPRQIFTRSKVRADVARIIELYKRQGRFAASVEPKAVQLDQNRVDIVFEINEGPKSKVRAINIIGNEEFSDSELRSEMYTKQSRFFRFFSSNTSYDPDRLAADQQKLRQFYLTEGYADFRVVSAVAELTPDKKDFIITYVVEEGDRYKFGDVKVESEIRDFDSEALTRNLAIKKGDWFNAKLVEDTVESLTETAGLFGYAFADVRPQYDPNREDHVMNITFQVADSDRTYVEEVEINGNRITEDKVIRREFRLAEGDAFNSFQVQRSANRIKSLGYFQDDLEIKQRQGSEPDRIILSTDVQERSTGELTLSAGFSSIENFIFQGSIQQRNFRGKGQTLRASASYSQFNKSVQLGFTEPYLFDKNIAISGDIFRKDYSNFFFGVNNDRQTNFNQISTGAQVGVGVPINEYLYGSLRYSLVNDDVTVNDRFRSDINGDGVLECDPSLINRYLCDAEGNRITSQLSYSLNYDTRDNRIRPRRGHYVTLTQDFAGLGGDVKFIRTKVESGKWWNVYNGFIFSVRAEGGYIHPLENRGLESQGVDDIRLTDRFFLGEPQIRGFDIRGIGPRVQRGPVLCMNTAEGGGDPVACNSNSSAADIVLNDQGEPLFPTDRNSIQDSAIGGRAYYLGRFELEVPLGSSVRELGLRPSVFVDIGSVFDITRPLVDSFLPGDPRLTTTQRFPSGNVACAVPASGDNPASTVEGMGDTCPAGATVLTSTGTPFQERFVGDSASPRVSIGAGVNWNSPFGPLRIDVATALLKQEGDDTKTFTFNVGTQF
ncbi:outer membrane protein assembly factor BamA [Novosphingopyxis iocasae]|uniref:outer membrane protein assembly factor BamA n=1 Tax=Novosphingopyxis iocasae TaxID=2762729 RepID=UPI00165178EE|nr:outer membrane protein assembly factor BamA [Novosphingopyxis iocasae]